MDLVSQSGVGGSNHQRTAFQPLGTAERKHGRTHHDSKYFANLYVSYLLADSHGTERAIEEVGNGLFFHWNDLISPHRPNRSSIHFEEMNFGTPKTVQCGRFCRGHKYLNARFRHGRKQGLAPSFIEF